MLVNYIIIVISSLHILVSNINCQVKLKGISRDYCFPERFEANCTSMNFQQNLKMSQTDRLLVMTSARYGRMRRGRCLRNAAASSLGCSADVLSQMDIYCSGKKSCSIGIPDERLHNMQRCKKDHLTYLEASFTCVSVQRPILAREKCPDAINIATNQRYDMNQHLTVGYLAPSTGSAYPSCPLHFYLPSWKKIIFTLFDFTWNTRNGNAQSCIKELFTISDNELRHDLTICSGQGRIKKAYVSSGRKVSITLKDVGLNQGSGYLLRYKVEGCSDPDVGGSGAQIRRISVDKALVRCNTTGEKWHLECFSGSWTGRLDDVVCPVGTDSIKQLRNFETNEQFPFGLVIAILAGILLGACLGFVFLGAIIVCQKRQQRHPCRSSMNHHGDHHCSEECLASRNEAVYATRISSCRLDQLNTMNRVPPRQYYASASDDTMAMEMPDHRVDSPFTSSLIQGHRDQCHCRSEGQTTSQLQEQTPVISKRPDIINNNNNRSMTTFG